MSAPPSIIQAANFSAGGRALITGSNDGVLTVWDPETGRPVGPAERGPSIFTICVSPNGAFWAIGDAHGGVTIRDSQSRRELSGWKAHASGITALDVSQDGDWLATGAREPGGTTLRVWRLGEDPGSPPAEAFSDHRHVTAVYALAFSADSRFLAAGGWTSSGYSGPVIYDLGSGHRVSSLVWECSRALRFSSDGEVLASGDEWGKISLWDIKSAGRRRQFEAHTGIVSVLRFSPDGRQLASGGCDGTIRLWDVASGAQALERACSGTILDAHSFGPDGWIVAAATPDPKSPLEIVRLVTE